ncbi:MAG: UvrD-helicase domain-containing protein [Holosporaceae bacterium]
MKEENVSSNALETASAGLPQTLLKKLQGLNPAQKKAVEATCGPVLILAGAGTGKTTVLTCKIAFLALQRCPLYHILAVTFTNKAAKEMKSRLIQLLEDETLAPTWLGTFHHIGVKIIRRHHDLLGLPQRFLILDTDDQLRLLKQLMKAKQLDDKKHPPRLFLWAIGRMKDRALLPHQISESELSRLGLATTHHAIFKELYTSYQAALLEMGACDFGDLILLCLKLFRDNPEVLSFYQNHFRYILVDEYQDINVAQYLWLRLLADGHKNICCVGDDDQSIYGWRGAEVDHILKFEKDFEGTVLIKLEENYRSTSAILKASSHLISNNQGRLGKTLYAADGKQGDALSIKGLSDDKAEARFIGHEINHLINQSVAADHIAILVRASFQTREIEECLLSMAIPYRLVGSTRFYERLEIKDALAYLRLLVNPKDNLAFERVMQTPKRGIGPTTLQKLYTFARGHNISLFEALEQALQPLKVEPLDLNKGAQTKLFAYAQDIYAWRTAFLELAPAEALSGLLEKAGYMTMWRDHKGEEAAARLENLKELFKVMQDFDTLDDFLEHASLVTDLASSADQQGVNVMTLHMAKGLEFDVVFLAGWEEGVFPHPKALEEHGNRGLEEERRLAYVGLTRARKKVIITTAASRRFFGGWQPSFPSRFLDELPHDVTNRDFGTRRFQALSRAPQKHTAFSVPQKSDGAAAFRPGDHVMHVTFGKGVVQAVQGTIATIAFEAGTHRIMTRFLSKA